MITYIGSSIGSFNTNKKNQMKDLRELMVKDEIIHDLNLEQSIESITLIRILTERKLIRDELELIKSELCDFDKNIVDNYNLL